MALAAAGPFEDLRTLIFGDHALELQHQLIFRRAGMWRLEENRLDAVAGELLGQQDLVGIFAAQPVRRVDQDSLNVALGGEIAQPLQTWPQQAGAAESLVLDDPLISVRRIPVPVRTRCSAAVWLAIVFSSFCCSEETLA